MLAADLDYSELVIDRNEGSTNKVPPARVTVRNSLGTTGDPANSVLCVWYTYQLVEHLLLPAGRLLGADFPRGKRSTSGTDNANQVERHRLSAKQLSDRYHSGSVVPLQTTE